MRWTDDEIKKLQDHYGQMPASDLVKRYFPNRTTVALNKKALKMNLSSDRLKMTSMAKKMYTCNTFFFTEPTLISSYWAGFIAADGCVVEKTRSLKIELSLKDHLHLEKFKDAIEFSGHVYKRSTCAINLYGFDDIVEGLNSTYSITPRKTFILQPPNIVDENHIRNFIRGYLDGDGSISRVSQGNTWRVSITSGSKDIIKWIKDMGDMYLPNIKSNIYVDRNHQQLVLGGSRQSLRFLEWLYKDSNDDTRLDRKYNTFLELRRRCEQIDSKIQTSKYRGVYFDKARAKWTCNIEFNGKKIYVGRFDLEQEAGLAYNQKALDLGLGNRCYEIS